MVQPVNGADQKVLNDNNLVKPEFSRTRRLTRQGLTDYQSAARAASADAGAGQARHWNRAGQMRDRAAHPRRHLLWGRDNSLFPATCVELGDKLHLKAVGIERKAWATAAPIRGVFKHGFEAAGLPYFKPHSSHITPHVCRSPEHFKAWSQNLGHERVLTIFISNGAVATQRQAEIIQSLGSQSSAVAGGSCDDMAETHAPCYVAPWMERGGAGRPGRGSSNRCHPPYRRFTRRGGRKNARSTAAEGGSADRGDQSGVPRLRARSALTSQKT